MSPEEFWRRTRSDGPCVLWTGTPEAGSGYGQLRWEGRKQRAHRVAFYLRLGRWPKGLLRHLCNRPLCVLHAVEGTHSENLYDRIAVGSHPNAGKSHCCRGHEFTPENTLPLVNGWRSCRACKALRDRGEHAELERLHAVWREIEAAA